MSTLEDRTFDISERQIRHLEDHGNYVTDNTSHIGPFHDGMRPEDDFLIDRVLAEVRPWTREHLRIAKARFVTRLRKATDRSGKAAFNFVTRALAVGAVLATTAEEAMANEAYRSMGGEKGSKLDGLSSRIQATMTAVEKAINGPLDDDSSDGFPGL